MTNLIKVCMLVFSIGLTFSLAQAQEKKDQARTTATRRGKLWRAKAKGATIKGFATEVEHGVKLYEASLTVNGHSKDILIDKNGKIMEVEEEVSMDSLPAAAQAALRKAAGSGNIR